MSTPHDWGDLHDYTTGKYIRRATEAEWRESVEAEKSNSTGAFEKDGQILYVEGGWDAV